jgi:hypothetical protein
MRRGAGRISRGQHHNVGLRNRGPDGFGDERRWREHKVHPADDRKPEVGNARKLPVWNADVHAVFELRVLMWPREEEFELSHVEVEQIDLRAVERLNGSDADLSSGNAVKSDRLAVESQPFDGV